MARNQAASAATTTAPPRKRGYLVTIRAFVPVDPSNFGEHMKVLDELNKAQGGNPEAMSLLAKRFRGDVKMTAHSSTRPVPEEPATPPNGGESASESAEG